MDVRGQAAVVTGGGSGLGAEVAAQLAAHGAKELADMVLTCVRIRRAAGSDAHGATLNGAEPALEQSRTGLGESDGTQPVLRSGQSI